MQQKFCYVYLIINSWRTWKNQRDSTYIQPNFNNYIRKTCPKRVMHPRVFLAQLRHAHFKTNYLEEKLPEHNEIHNHTCFEMEYSQIFPLDVYFSFTVNNITCMQLRRVLQCNPHLRLVDVNSILNSADILDSLHTWNFRTSEKDFEHINWSRSWC